MDTQGVDPTGPRPPQDAAHEELSRRVAVLESEMAALKVLIRAMEAPHPPPSPQPPPSGSPAVSQPTPLSAVAEVSAIPAPPAPSASTSPVAEVAATALPPPAAPALPNRPAHLPEPTAAALRAALGKGAPAAMPLPQPAFASTSGPAAPLTSSSFLESPSPGAPEAAAPPALAKSLEFKLAPILMGCGGVILLIGFAFLSLVITSIMPPVGKTAIGFAFAGLLAVASQFIRRKNETTGRVGLGIALSVGYFVSFGAGFIDAMKCVSFLPSVVLMIAFAGAIVAFAERWRSEGTAIYAFFLSIVAALVSARDNPTFTLVALVILALAAGVFLVRNEWQKLTFAAVVGAYLSMLAYWFIIPVPQESGPVTVNLAALASFYLVFSAAFWKWGRKWLAREAALDESRAREALPDTQLGPLAYSSGTVILNSLGFIGSSVWLLHTTGVLWPNLHWLLFALAAAEGVRLFVAPFNRGAVQSFHAITSFSLIGAGIVVATSGLEESAVLAAQALIVAIAASRARELRLLRPLSALCAFLAVKEFSSAGAPATLADVAPRVLPGLFLLLSCLPWEHIWVRHPRDLGATAFKIFDRLSSVSRAVVGALMIGAALDAAQPVIGPEATTIPVYAFLLLVGMILLRGRPWIAAVSVIFLAALYYMTTGTGPTPLKFLLFVVWITMMTALFEEASRLFRHIATRVLIACVAVVIAMAACGIAGGITESMPGMQGVAMLVLSASVFAAGAGVRHVTPLPSLVREPWERPEDGTDTGANWGGWKALGLSPMIGALALLAGPFMSAFVDARAGAYSPAIVAALALLAAWLLSRRGERNQFAEATLAAIALGTLSAGFSVAFRNPALAGLVVTGVTIAVALVSLKRTSWGGLSVVMLMALILPAVATQVIQVRGADVFSGIAATEHPLRDAVLGLAAAAGMILLARLALRAAEVAPSGAGWAKAFAVAGAFHMASGAIVAMIYLALPGFLPKLLVTVSWALLGGALLVLGFMVRERTPRMFALAIFVVAIGRLFWTDLAGAELLVKAVAALGVGVLLVAAGFAYALFQKRADAQPPAPPTP